MKHLLFLLAVVLLSSSAFPITLGLEFKASGDEVVALNIGFSDQFELKPQVGFQLGDAAHLNLIIDGNIYLPDISPLRHYIGPSLIFSTWDNGNSNADNTSFYLGGHYGLRYNVNEVISLFGEIGIILDFDPDFAMTSFRPGLGCTFYLPAFN